MKKTGLLFVFSQRKLRYMAITLLCVMGLPCLLSMQVKKEVNEHTVKALYLYNFTKYMEWSKEKNKNYFVIGFIGSTPVYEELKQVCSAKKVKNRDFELRLVKDVSEADECDVVYITKGNSLPLKKLVTIANGNEILIVTEEEGLAQKGAGANIVKINDKFKFELNTDEIKKTGIVVASQLIPLAIIVKN